MARGRGTPAVGQPKAPTVTHAARERMLRTLFRYGLTEGSVADLEAQVRALERLPEAQREELRGLVRLLGRRNAERDRKWWPLPPEAYDGELRFLDGPRGWANVPARKKRAGGCTAV